MLIATKYEIIIDELAESDTFVEEMAEDMDEDEDTIEFKGGELVLHLGWGHGIEPSLESTVGEWGIHPQWGVVGLNWYIRS